ncbi:ribonuclease HII [Kineosporia succinea]|uniref:Ribonuclease n=1 Tax=Kineosporia succinea TaxID=84632 RepID=A0ABT9NWE4_9ACTN|nr:ribonuclease HII [Kineosporia succinea]MDP9824737.1 ribonuclease HII [Kineosporia succinea]
MTPASGRPLSKKAAASQAAAQRAKARKAAAKKALLKKLTAQPPTLREERKLLREGHRFVAGVDEVGRGALAGPVTVGVVVIDLETKSAPTGVKDSKLLAPAVREKLVPKLRRWAPMSAVGHASSGEIDEIGIIGGLRLAAARAFAQLEIRPDCALLDGSHDWLTVPADAVEEAPQGTALFDFDETPVAVGHPLTFVDGEPLSSIVPARVVTQVKADLRCAAVAAASVLAKVERDGLMVGFADDHPGYGWELNKGYSAPDHLAALRRLGPSRMHRLSWNIPGSDGVYGETLDLDGLDSPVVPEVDSASDLELAEALEGIPAEADSASDLEELVSSEEDGVRGGRAELAPPKHGRAVGYDHEELTLFP